MRKQYQYRVLTPQGVGHRYHVSTIPACGPCATALEALGWSPEKEDDHA